MKSHFNFLMLALAVLFCSCDPVYSIDYEIENNSSKSILIVYQINSSTERDSSIISKNTTIRIFEDSGIGSSSKDRLEDVSNLPFLDLEISDLDDKNVKIDLQNLENWSRLYYDDRDRGLVSIKIFDGSF